MKLLLDTHVLLWWLAGNRRLDAAARQAIADPDNLVVVSAASLWEISIKAAIGKVTTPAGLAGRVVEAGFEPLSIDLVHAEAAGALPPHHRDPFDRMLVAQALLEGLKVVTRDEKFDVYGVATMPA